MRSGAPERAVVSAREISMGVAGVGLVNCESVEIVFAVTKTFAVLQPANYRASPLKLRQLVCRGLSVAV